MFTNKRATSMIELMITITIFSIVAVFSIVVLMNTMRSTRKIQSQVFLYTEAQALMDQLARSVERNTVDYEAYYHTEVYLPVDSWHTKYYGVYGQAFYDPGTGGPTAGGPYSGIDYYEANCVSVSGTYPEDCPSDVPVYSELDLNTGTNPFEDIDNFAGYTYDTSYMNAFCASADGSTDCTDIQHNVTDELILINSAGDERTVFLRELTDTDDYRLSKVQLAGTDTDNDGIVDTWACTDKYSCSGSSNTPDSGDLDDADDPQDDDFMPITPSSISVEEFYIYVVPNEDPYRAFAEEDAQIQPQVTIILTVSLANDYSGGVLGEVPSITIQRTISTGVYSAITSYE